MPTTPEIWLEEFIVAPFTADGSIFDPKITQLANGNILVSWSTTADTGAGSPNGNDVLGRLFDPSGTPISDEFRLNGLNSGEEQDADVEGLPAGGMMTVYERSFSGLNSIVLTEASATGTGAVNTFIFSDSTANDNPSGFDPAIATSSNTSALVVWRENEVGTDSRIVGAIYNSTTNTAGSLISL